MVGSKYQLSGFTRLTGFFLDQLDLFVDVLHPVFGKTLFYDEFENIYITYISII